MITSSGAICDICDEYILCRNVNEFSVKGITEKLHCHDHCKELLQNSGGNYKKLPEGRLKRAFTCVAENK